MWDEVWAVAPKEVWFFFLLGAIGALGLARIALVKGLVGHLLVAAVVSVFFCIPVLFLSDIEFGLAWRMAAGVIAGTALTTAARLVIGAAARR